MIHMRHALTGALLMVGSATLVSAQQATPPQGTHGKHAEGGRGRMGGPGLRGQLFRGITLSEAEKTNIKHVQAKFAPQMKALREQSKPQMDSVRAARQRGDSAAIRQLFEKSAPQREQTKQLALAERNELRAALTPANQAIFDANVAAAEKRLAERPQNGGGRRGGHRPPGQTPPVR